MRNENEQKLKNILSGMIDEYQLKQKLYEAKIQELWPKMMGNSIGNYTKSIRLRKEKLYIEIVSAPLKQELSYGRDKIKVNLNEELGEEFIKDVIIR